MRKYYPEVVEAYEESIKKPPKEKKTRTRKKKENDNPNQVYQDKPKRKYNRKPKTIQPIENLNASMKSLDLKAKETNTSALNVSVNVNRLKRKIKNNTKKGQKTLNSFIAIKKRRTSNKLMQSLRKSLKNMSLNCDVSNNMYNVPFNDDCNLLDDQHGCNKENKVNPNYLSLLNNTESEISDGDLSNIIDQIISRPPEIKTAKVDNKLVKLVFEKYSTPKKMSMRKSILTQIHNNCSTPRDSPVRKSNFRFSTNSNNNSMIGKVNTSYFFDKLTEDGDAFEMSLEHKGPVVLSDSTIEYSLPDVCL